MFQNEKYKPNIAEGTAEIVIDQVKTFSQEVNRRNDSTLNLVSFELLNIESATTRTIEAQAEKAVRMAAGTEEKLKKVTLIGSGDFHLWELINEEQGEKTVIFRCKEQKVCEMDIEFLCKYGELFSTCTTCSCKLITGFRVIWLRLLSSTLRAK